MTNAIIAMPDCHRFSFHAMGSPCAIHLYADSATQAQQAAQQMRQEVLRLEQKYSRYRDDSITAAINRAAAAGASIEVDEETAALLDYADTLWQQSESLFDITSGLLRRAWDFKSGMLPPQNTIDALLPRIGWHRVKWSRPQLHFPQPGMELDFGGYVKEYGADCAAAVAQQQGVQHGLVELGGDIRVIGPHPDGRPWSIGIRHPREPGSVLADIQLEQGALASSGDYERCIEIDGRIYGHILDPRSGWPVSGLIAVSVVADHCLLAGTGATVAMLKGSEGTAWLEQLGLPWLAMDADGRVYGTLADPLSCAHA